MEQFRCRYNCASDEEWHDVTAMDMEHAVEMFAESRYSRDEMYECGEDWGDEDYAIVVEDTEGNKKLFQIFVHIQPHFSSGEIEDEKKYME